MSNTANLYEENTNGLGAPNPYERYMNQFGAPPHHPQQQHTATQENNLFSRFGMMGLQNENDEIVNRDSNNYENPVSRVNEDYSQHLHHPGNQFNFMDRFGGGFDFNFNFMERVRNPLMGAPIPTTGVHPQHQQPLQSTRMAHYMAPTHYPQYHVQYLPDSFFQQHQQEQIQSHNFPQQQWSGLPQQVVHPQSHAVTHNHTHQSQTLQQSMHYPSQTLENMQLSQQVVEPELLVDNDGEGGIEVTQAAYIQQQQAKNQIESKQDTKEAPKVKLSWVEFHSLSKPATSITPPSDATHRVEANLTPTPSLNSSGSNIALNSINNTSSKASTPTPTAFNGIDDPNGQELQVSRTLWVGNIGPDVTEQELADEFAHFGELESVRILHDRFCAFVNFVDEEHATAAKKAMHGQIIGSQYIVVNYRQTKQGDEVSQQQEASSYAPPSRALYIGNLAESVIEKDLKRECEKYGEIDSIRILHKKGCAFVNYVSVKNATAALHALQGRRLNDQVIKVNYGKAVPSKSGREESVSSSSTIVSKAPRLPGRSNATSPTHTTPPLAPLNAWTSTNTNVIRPVVASPAPSPAVSWSGISAIKDNPLTASQELGARDWLAENGLDICEVCYTNFRNTLFIPCYHTCCGECMSKLRASAVYTADKGSRCPFCKEVIKQYVAISSPLTTPNHPPSFTNNNNSNTNTNNNVLGANNKTTKYK